MTTPKQTIQEFIAAFVSAWPDRDAARVASFFSDDAVYHNIPMEPVRGREAIAATVGGFMTMGGQARVDVGHIVAEGAIVMVERVDYFVGEQRTIVLPVVGVFEVHDGKITAWRDYFDPAGLAAVREDRRAQSLSERKESGVTDVAVSWQPTGRARRDSNPQPSDP